MSTIHGNHLFHIMDDVCISSLADFGYVFAIAESENMLLIKSFDGKQACWYHPEDLELLSLASAWEAIASPS